MATYSVAAAKDAFSQLIDQALEGEEVVITRHGKPVVELRRADVPQGDAQVAHDWLWTRLSERPAVGVTSVELLSALREEEDERLLGR